MLIESCRRGSYQVFRVRDEMTVHSDLSELKKIIHQHIDEGARNFALTFTPTSYLYTKSLSVLVQCTDMIRKRGGSLAIVDANQDIRDILTAISFDSIVRMVPNMESLD